MSAQAFARSQEHARPINIPRDNWLGFVGDILKFTAKLPSKRHYGLMGTSPDKSIPRTERLSVSAGAKLSEAVINVAVARINGTVEGQVNASELVLSRTANVTGDVTARTLIMEEGALFNGRCHNI